MADDLSQKEFWVAAYLAAFRRVDHEAALIEADAALAACNERWRERIVTKHGVSIDSFPLGMDANVDDDA